MFCYTVRVASHGVMPSLKGATLNGLSAEKPATRAQAAIEIAANYLKWVRVLKEDLS